jgi:hypothetical protein
MLIIKSEIANTRYGGLHPVTEADLTKVLWKDLPQDVLEIVYSDERNRAIIFDAASELETPKQKQAENVNTTAPNTRATGSTTTTAKTTVSEG